MLRFLLWRVLGLIAFLLAVTLVAWLLDGGLGATLRGAKYTDSGHLKVAAAASALGARLRFGWRWAPLGGVSAAGLLTALVMPMAAFTGSVRWHARRRRRYVRMRVETYRTDKASAEAVVSMFEALHKRLLASLVAAVAPGSAVGGAGGAPRSDGAVWLAVTCPVGLEGMVQAALRTAYPNCRLVAERQLPGRPRRCCG